MNARMMYLHALSPVHTGTGQAVDVIDLPVAREKTTNWPYIPGSTIKGVLRDLCDADGANGGKGSLPWQAFGPNTANADSGAGALLFGDGRLLCLPVRSLYGTFAWVTCPLALARYARDHAAAGLAMPPVSDLAGLADDHIALPEGKTADDRIILPEGKTVIETGGTVYLEDLDLAAKSVADLVPLAGAIAGDVFTDAAWRAHFMARFGVVGDTTFTFLTETATVVTARIRINDDTKTVADGALWYEEAIPAESIFSAPLLVARRTGSDAAALFDLVADRLDGVVQIGGNASVGRGMMQVRLVGARP